MFIGTLNKPGIFQIVFGLAAVPFFVVAAADYTGNATIRASAGILCSFSAFYLAMAETLKESYGKKILPSG